MDALYLGPLFSSSTHGYDTADYYHVDQRLGTNETLARLVQQLHAAGIRVVLDGEIVVLDEKGRPQFKLLQNWLNDAAGTLVYYVFDIIYLQGYDLCNLSLLRPQGLHIPEAHLLPKLRCHFA